MRIDNFNEQKFIKVGVLLAYDYEFVKNSLPKIYPYADKIFYSLDIERRSWSGSKFPFDEGILGWIKEYDTLDKIQIREASYFSDLRSPMENDTYQRNDLAKFMGEGGWHIQIDVDEYFVNFEGFVKYLRENKRLHKLANKYKTTISIFWINLFKSDSEGFFYIKDSVQSAKIATNYPVYYKARNTYQFNIFLPFFMVHQSYDRPESELLFKLTNYSHKEEIDGVAYVDFWKSINVDNFHKVKNFFPTEPKNAWKRLGYIPAKDINQLVEQIEKSGIKVSRFYLYKKNIIQNILRIGPIFKWYQKLINKHHI